MAATTHRRGPLAPALFLVAAMFGTATPLVAQHRAVFRSQVFDSAGTALADVEVTLREAERVSSAGVC